MVTARALRIDADAGVLPDGLPPLTLLYPFHGAPASAPGSPTGGRFDRYVAVGRELVELTGPDEADVCVLPVAWEHVERLPEADAIGRRYAERARAHGIPLVVFYVADSEEPVPVGDAWVYRTSLRRSRRGPRELAMPALSMDVVRQELGDLEVRPWAPRPTVGFCGYAPGAEPARSARSVARAVKRASGSRAATWPRASTRGPARSAPFAAARACSSRRSSATRSGRERSSPADRATSP